MLVWCGVYGLPLWNKYNGSWKIVVRCILINDSEEEDEKKLTIEDIFSDGSENVIQETETNFDDDNILSSEKKNDKAMN